MIYLAIILALVAIASAVSTRFWVEGYRQYPKWGCRILLGLAGLCFVFSCIRIPFDQNLTPLLNLGQAPR